jgi:uncharacterized protein
MGKIAIWILIAIAVMLALRLIAGNKRRRDDGDGSGGSATKAHGKSARPGDRDDAERGGNGGELMMSCAVCGVHLPASEAVFAGGKVFCGPEHRDVDEARRG